MSPMRAPRPRKLVLGRETVRSLSERPLAAITIQPQEMTSCFPDCGGACGMQVY